MRRALPVFFSCLLPSLLYAQQEAGPTKPAAQTPAAPAIAAAQTPQHRPKIGVALEGGGAMGLAHIGVLKWFEEHHIPVDYVAGTSMGGLVGGFYATGMTPEEMQQLIEGLDWRKIRPYSLRRSLLPPKRGSARVSEFPDFWAKARIVGSRGPDRRPSNRLAD